MHVVPVVVLVHCAASPVFGGGGVVVLVGQPSTVSAAAEAVHGAIES